MSKIVFFNIPAYGHVNPTLPVVRELVTRGEQVIYYNHEEFRQVIAPTGATFRPYPPSSLSAAAVAEAVGSGNLANVSNLLLGVTDELLPFVLDELKREQPDLVVFDSTVLWGRMAATLLKLRAAASISTFVFGVQQAKLPPLELAKMIARLVTKVPALVRKRARLIRHYGKDAYPQGQPLFPMRAALNLVYTSRALQPEMSLIDDTFRFVGPSIDPQTRQEAFPFDTLAAGPLVYISLGTVHVGQAEFYRQCFAAFGDYPAQFILSVGRKTDPASLGTIPANFTVRQSVPQLAVLERADAFISHAGMNSVQESLYYGVPVVAIPQQFEQLVNATAVQQRGAGIVLREQLLRGKLDPAALRPALDAVLNEPHYREAARAVQATLRATGGYREAADALQAHIAS